MVRPLIGGVVMAFKMLSVAALAAQLLAIPSWTQFGGPANLPPVGFKGQQFVDSRGCLFLRAGFGGSVNWATRADGNHKPICGMAPTGSAAARKAVAEDNGADGRGGHSAWQL